MRIKRPPRDRCINHTCRHAYILEIKILRDTRLCQRCYQRNIGMVPGIEPICTKPGCTEPYDDLGYCTDHRIEEVGPLPRRKRIRIY